MAYQTFPAYDIVDNLVVTRHGTVWAIWRLKGVPYMRAGLNGKKQMRLAIKHLCSALPEESLLLTLWARVDPLTVVGQTLDGVDTDNPMVQELAAAHLEVLGDDEIRKPTHWVAVPLPHLDARNRFGSYRRAAQVSFAESFGLPWTKLPDDEVSLRLTQAQRMASQFPSSLGHRPATPAEILWIYAHQHLRGTSEEPPLPAAEDYGQLLRSGLSLAEFRDAIFFEGGAKDDRLESMRRPLIRRYLRIDAHEQSYQSNLVIADMPRHFTFPGTEWFTWPYNLLTSLDDTDPFCCDVAVRLRSVRNEDAQKKARRQRRELIGQYEEFDGDIAGAPPELGDASAALDQESAELAVNKLDPELQPTIILTVWGDSVDKVEHRADRIEALYRPNQFPVPRPTGEQEDMFWAGVPGSPRPRVCDDYKQFLLPSGFAAGMPFVDVDLGDPTGFILGYLTEVGVTYPVMLDLEATLREQRAASMAFTGELGSGKSVAMKTVTYYILSRGGRGITIDRTPMGEWAKFAKAMRQWAHQRGYPLSVNVITVSGDIAFSFDPLRMLPRHDEDEEGNAFDLGRQIAEGTLSILLGYDATSPHASMVSEVLDRIAPRPDRSMTMLIREMESLAYASASRGKPVTPRPSSDGDEPDVLKALADDDAAIAWEIRRQLRAIARRPTSRALFDESLPVVRLDEADFTVLHTPNLPLPPKEVVNNPSAKLSFEQIHAQALVYVATAACRYVAFRDNRMTVVPLDECWFLNNNHEGQQLRYEIIRDGRKHRSAVLLGSHDADDFGDEATRGLLKYRFAFRQGDENLAKRNAAFVGLDTSDPGTLELVNDPELPSGRCVLFDRHGNKGVLHIAMPPLQDVRDGMLTHTGVEPTPALPQPIAEQHVGEP
ncbi:MAG: ATP-binding protein [Streptosporangiales bacterium]|nr:ATP-binding protein [Streptosporangiales bacterium]MBO0889958.1 ATP-binding protein [Acidothermales bacterium]